MSNHRPVCLPVQRDRSPDEEAALEATISRHPAGRRQRRPRPLPAVTVIVVDEVGEPIEAR